MSRTWTLALICIPAASLIGAIAAGGVSSELGFSLLLWHVPIGAVAALALSWRLVREVSGDAEMRVPWRRISKWLLAELVAWPLLSAALVPPLMVVFMGGVSSAEGGLQAAGALAIVLTVAASAGAWGSAGALLLLAERRNHQP